MAQFVIREKHRQKLIRAFADLPANRFERNFLIELLKGDLPGLRMKIDGIDQCTINVEDYCFNHDSVFIPSRANLSLVLPGWPLA